MPGIIPASGGLVSGFNRFYRFGTVRVGSHAAAFMDK